MQSESLSNTLDSNFNWVIPQNIFVCMDISYATSNGRKNVRNLNIFPPPRNAFVFYYKMYLSQIPIDICLKFQNIFVCNDMQCNLSWDGRENVRNFNIFPPLKNASRILLQIQRKNMKISKKNKYQNWKIFLAFNQVFWAFISSRFCIRRNQLLIYSGSLLLTDQFLTWKRNTKREENSKELWSWYLSIFS